MYYQDPVCGISVIKIMFHEKISSYYGDHTIRYFWTSFVIKKKKCKKGYVLESTDCPELDVVRPYSETTEYSLNLNHCSEEKQIYSWGFDSEFVIQLLFKTWLGKTIPGTNPEKS